MNCARLGVPVTVVMPIDAPEAKRRATEQYGATVILSDHGERAREEAASKLSKTLAVEKSLTLLYPFDDPLIVAGPAGAGIEAIEQLDGQGQGVELVLCCVGGGGLIGAISLAFHFWRPDTEISDTFEQNLVHLNADVVPAGAGTYLIAQSGLHRSAQ